MDAERKHLARTLKALRQALEAGDVGTFRTRLQEEPRPLILTALREQRLVTHIRAIDQAAVFEILSASAQARLDTAAAAAFRRYLTFAKLFDATKQKIQARLAVVLHALPKLNAAQLIGAAGGAFDRLLDHLPQLDIAASTSVANYERLLHDLNGLTNDTTYAVLRALNEASKIALAPNGPNLGRSDRVAAQKRMLKASLIASELNGLEWLFDGVTYGDLEVGEISETPPAVVFHHADARRTLLRILAIRRDLVLNVNRARAPRFVRDTLKLQERQTLEAAVDFYSWLGGIDPKTVELDPILHTSAAVLIAVNAEDDLLIAAGGDAIAQTHYNAAILLRWFMMAAVGVRRTLPRGRRHLLSAPDIPLGDIADGLNRGGGQGIQQALRALTVTLPARSHYELIRHPFVRVSENLAHSVLASDGGVWNLSVRETLVNGGGPLGDAYGRVWEDFYARSFEDGSWTILGRNLQLRRGGRLITDIDMLLKRHDLLVVLQIKALIGSGVSPYDHWRNRQTIEWGCRQAKVACAFIREHPEWLVSVAGRRNANEVVHVQPLVLTTLDHVDGWKFEGVPVIAEVGRKAITVGSKVTYIESGTGEVVSTQHIIPPEELSTERILWALDNPLELQLAPEIPTTRHTRRRIGDLRVAVPDFEMDIDVDSYPLGGASASL